jgi:CTP synthase (UTP-ammonia lyase)
MHGECYVTDDGAETDLDLGHERFWMCQHQKLIMLPQVESICLWLKRKKEEDFR